eukprot:6443673-Karenia_brevis.AAC.1
MAHGALSQHTRGRSATMDLALSGRQWSQVDPAIPSTATCIYMLCCALWENWVSRAWIFKRILAAEAELSSATRPWSKVNGPISAAVASCHRIGWHFQATPSKIRT